jgi:hypothetical protein
VQRRSTKFLLSSDSEAPRLHRIRVEHATKIVVPRFLPNEKTDGHDIWENYYTERTDCDRVVAQLA